MVMTLRRFLGSALLAALAASGYAAPTAEKVQSTDEAAAEAVEVAQPPRTPRRRLVRSTITASYLLDPGLVRVSNESAHDVARILVYSGATRADQSAPVELLVTPGVTTSLTTPSMTYLVVEGTAPGNVVATWEGAHDAGTARGLETLLNTNETGYLAGALDGATQTIRASATRNSGSVTYTIKDETGVQRGATVTVPLDQYSSVSTDVFTAAGVAPFVNARIEATPNMDDVLVTLQGVAGNDARHQDAIATRMAQGMSTLPVLERNVIDGVSIMTAAWFYNPEAASETVVAAFRVRNDKSGNTTPIMKTVEAGQQLGWSDAILGILGNSAGYWTGATTNTSTGILIPTSTYAAITANGTFTTTIPAAWLKNAAGGADEAPAVLLGLRENSEWTTHLGLVSYDQTSTTTLTIKGRQADGTPAGQFTYELAAKENRLFTSVIASELGATGVNELELLITNNWDGKTDETNDKFHAYIILENKNTHERHYIKAQHPSDPAVNYVRNWLGDNVVWLNPWESDQIVTQYKNTMASILANNPSEIPAWEGFLENLIDGEYFVGTGWEEEFWEHGDPFMWQRNLGRLDFYLKWGSDGNDMRVSREDGIAANKMQALHDSVFVPGLTNLVRTNPERYGGQPGGQANKEYDPTWGMQNNVL